MNDDERLTGTLKALVAQLHQLWIEKEACAGLAMAHGATLVQVEQAKQAALDDPTIQRETREQFSGMWKALEEGAQTLRFAELLQSLPPTDKPN